MIRAFDNPATLLNHAAGVYGALALDAVTGTLTARPDLDAMIAERFARIAWRYALASVEHDDCRHARAWADELHAALAAVWAHRGPRSHRIGCECDGIDRTGLSCAATWRMVADALDAPPRATE